MVNHAGSTFEAVLSVVFGCPLEGDVPIERVVDIAAQLVKLRREPDHPW